MKRLFPQLMVIALAMFLISCAGANQQERHTKHGALIGAGAGAALGAAIGGDVKGALIGAGVGALAGGLAGNQIGAYMDRQEQALRDAMAQSEAASIKRSEDVLTATFKGDVFFDLNSSVPKPGAQKELERVATVLNQYPQTMITIEGHTDQSGPADYNQRLSEARAESVRSILVQKGVDPARLRTIGYGETQPISSSPAMNRRVNVVITPIQAG